MFAINNSCHPSLNRNFHLSLQLTAVDCSPFVSSMTNTQTMELVMLMCLSQAPRGLLFRGWITASSTERAPSVIATKTVCYARLLWNNRGHWAGRRKFSATADMPCDESKDLLCQGRQGLFFHAVRLLLDNSMESNISYDTQAGAPDIVPRRPEFAVARRQKGEQQTSSIS